MGAGRLGIVEGDALLQVRTGSGPFSQEGQEIAQRDMHIREVYWILDTLGQAEQLLSQLPSALILPPTDIKTHQTPNTGESCGVSPTCWHSSRARA